MRFKKIWRIFSAMTNREKILTALLAAVFILSIAQFINSEVHFPAFKEGGVFAEGFVGHIRSINPLFTDFNDADRDVGRLIFSGLIKYDPNQKNFLPDIAEKWDVSKNGLIYTFTLRRQAVWHDGKPVTSDDVSFTFQNVIQHPAFRNPVLKNAFEAVKINKIDAYNISFILPKQNSYFISNLIVGLLPKHILENEDISALDKSKFSRFNPIGSGPFKLTSLNLDDDGDIVDLEIFEQYYGKKPLIKRIRLFTFPDEKSLIKDKSALNAISKLNTKEIFSDSRFTTYNYTLNQFTSLHFNTENPFLKEQKMRQAMALALNKQELLNVGEQRVDSLGLTDRSKEEKFKFDPEAAKKIIDELGFINGSDGFRSISFNLLALNIMPEELTNRIKNQFNAIGIKVEIQRVKSSDFYKYIEQKRYDMLLIRHYLGYNRDVYSLFHSSQIIDPEKGLQGLNFSNFKSFKTDGLTEALRKEPTPADKEKLLAQLSTAISFEIPLVFISTPIYTYGLDKTVPEIKLNNLNSHSDRLSILTNN